MGGGLVANRFLPTTYLTRSCRLINEKPLYHREAKKKSIHHESVNIHFVSRYVYKESCSFFSFVLSRSFSSGSLMSIDNRHVQFAFDFLGLIFSKTLGQIQCHVSRGIGFSTPFFGDQVDFFIGVFFLQVVHSQYLVCLLFSLAQQHTWLGNDGA